MRGDGTEHDDTLGETAAESYPEGFDTDPSSPGFVPEAEVVPLDEPSMEDYPSVLIDEFGAPIKAAVPIHDGVRDTQNR